MGLKIKTRISLKTIEVIVSEQFSGQRLDVFVSGVCPDISRSAAARLIEQGDVLLSNSHAKKNTIIAIGDKISINLPPPTSMEAMPQAIPIEIVYEDSDLVIVNKQKGMVVHPAPGNPDNTLVNALLYHCRHSLSGIGGVERPGIVHRIDKDTSGLLVVAKNDKAHLGLAEQLSRHDIKRCYHAVAKGNFKDLTGTVNAPIARDKNNRLRMTVDHYGRQAMTDYEVITQYRDYCHLQLKLHTGRTHQIRVHMRSIGHPLAGDTLYGEPNNPKLNGQCLHAKSLEFVHPITGKNLIFETELPDYFTNFLNKIKPLAKG